MTQIKVGDTTHPIMVLMIDSSDHVSPKTGLTLTVTRSKNGSAYASWSGSTAEIANGVYKLTAASGDVDTAGELWVHVTASGADPVDLGRVIVAYDPYSATSLGLSAMPIDMTQTVTDVGGAATTHGGILSLLRAMAGGKLTVVSGVLKLFGTNGSTQIGVDRTITGSVPADVTRQ